MTLWGVEVAVALAPLCPHWIPSLFVLSLSFADVVQGHSFPSFFEGQFIVRKEGILRHPRSFYEGLMLLFLAPPTHWIHRNTSGGVHKVGKLIGTCDPSSLERQSDSPEGEACTVPRSYCIV